MMAIAGDAPVGLLVVAAVLFLLLVILLATYNRLVGLRNRVRESWSNVDTELKRRHDLVPNLVAAVKGYAAHERAVLERVTELRTLAERQRLTGRPCGIADSERELARAVNQLLAVAEQYPVLKADRNYRDLMSELALTEDRIQAARRFYNANVRDLNNLVDMFPSSLVAGLGGFSSADFFQLEDASHRLAPRVGE